MTKETTDARECTSRPHCATIPSGVVRLNREFELTANSATTIVLDFDGDKSVHQTGNGRFMMQPVVNVVSVQ